MVARKTNSNNQHAVGKKPTQRKSHRPLLAQKFSVASKEIGNLARSTEATALNTIDFYVDGKGLNRRTVGQLSREEPEGRLFNATGEPVILGPGQQLRYLYEQQQKLRNPNGKYEFLESVEEQHGGSLRFEPWYTDLFWEEQEQLRAVQMAGFVGINEQVRKAYDIQVIQEKPRCQDYYDQKYGRPRTDHDDNAVTQ